MNAVSILACASVLSLGAVADDSTEDLTIAEIVAASGGEFDDNPDDFDILLTAVKAADLVGPLADAEASLTVFAPNDKAFMRLATDLGWGGETEEEAWGFLVEALTGLGDGDPIRVLTKVLLYHVVGEELAYSQVVRRGATGQAIETLLEDATFTSRGPKLTDNAPDLENPRIIPTFNIDASNGVIHTIDRVLIPIPLP